MLSSHKSRSRINKILDPVGAKLADFGVSPNAVTIIGLAIIFIVGGLIAYSHLFAAGFLMLFGGVFDTLDGAVARAKKLKSSAGALFDSVIDRYAEAAIFLGLSIYFFVYNRSLYGFILTFTSMTGSFLVSYVRARAEGLDIQCDVGLMQRAERMLLLAIGLVFHNSLQIQRWFPKVDKVEADLLLILVLAVLSLTSHYTAIYRLVFAYRRLANMVDG